MNLFRSIMTLLVCLSISHTYANEAISISTSLSGGIAGVQTSIQPNIEFESSAPIFDHLTITTDDIGRQFSISSNQDDPNFSAFIRRVTDADDDLMKVGHTIGYVKGNLGNYETTWFEQKDLYQKSIKKITIEYSKIEFGEPYFKDNDYWTDFKYELTITFEVSNEVNMDFVDFSVEELWDNEGQARGKKTVLTKELLKKQREETPKQRFRMELKVTPKEEKN